MYGVWGTAQRGERRGKAFRKDLVRIRRKISEKKPRTRHEKGVNRRLRGGRTERKFEKSSMLFSERYYSKERENSYY